LKEKELIKACSKGSPEAQKQLYDLYGPGLMGLCLRYAGNREDAEEIFHDAMMKVYHSISKFKDQSKLSTWINRIGINCAIDFLRKKRNALIVEHITDRISEIGEKDDIIPPSIEAELAMKLLKTMPLGQQMIINMFVIDEMSHKEIAKELNISEVASRTQYSRAKKALHELFRNNVKKNETGKSS